MPVYSFSQIRIYEQCPLKYRYQYIDKLPRADFVMSPDLLLGSSVHFALEKLYKQINLLDIPTQEKLIGRAEQYWHENKGTDMEFTEDRSEEIYLKRARVYLTQYYEQHAPFEDVKVVMTEGNIVFSLDENEGIKFRGVIDRLDKQGSAFIINDYKTNKYLPTESTDVYREQLTLYALGVKEKYGKHIETISARLYYLHFDLVDEWDIGDEDISIVSNKYKNIVKSIEQERFSFNMGNKETFEATENPGCKFCDYVSICPLRTHMQMEDEIVVGDTTIKSMIDDYADITKQMSTLQKEKESLKETIVTYMRSKDLQRVFGQEHQVSNTPMTSYTVENSIALEQFLSEKGLLQEVKKIDRYALARLIKDEDVSLDELGGSVVEKKSPVLRVKKI